MMPTIPKTQGGPAAAGRQVLSAKLARVRIAQQKARDMSANVFESKPPGQEGPKKEPSPFPLQRMADGIAARLQGPKTEAAPRALTRSGVRQDPDVAAGAPDGSKKVTHIGAGKIFQGLINDRYAAAGFTVNVAGRRGSSLQPLADQEGAYSLAQDGSSVLVFHNIDHISAFDQAEGRRQVVEDVASPATRILSMSMGERGYQALDQSQLRTEGEKVAKGETEGLSTFGLLALGLKERFLAGDKAPVLFAFENAPSDAGERAVVQLYRLGAAAQEAALTERKQGNEAMPSLDDFQAYMRGIFAPPSMIDRIVPGNEAEPREVRTQDGARFNDEIATNTEAYKGQITLLGDPEKHDIPDIKGFRWVRTREEFDGVKADKRNLLNTMHAAAGVMSGLPFDGSPTTLPELMDGKETQLGFDAVMDSITHATPDRGGVRAGDYSAEIKSRLANTAMGDGGEKLERLGSQMPRKLNGYIKPTLVDILRQGGNVDRLMNVMVVAAKGAEAREYQAYRDSRGTTEGPKSQEAFLDQYEGYPITKDAILLKVPEDVRNAFGAAWDRAETRRGALGDKTLLLPQDYADLGHRSPVQGARSRLRPLPRRSVQPEGECARQPGGGVCPRQ